MIPTTTLTLESPTAGTDEFGDEVDTYTIVEAEVPAHMEEVSKNVFDPTDGRWHTVRYFKALLHNRQVAKGWRITDERTGRKFFVDYDHELTNFVVPQAHRVLELTEVTRTTT